MHLSLAFSACLGAAAGWTRLYANADVTIRLSGFVEAVTFTRVMAPRIVGQNSLPMVIQKLPANGATVRKGDVIVEFDRQQQLRAAREKETEWLELDAQLRKKRAELAMQAAKDETEVKAADAAVTLAQLDLLKNDMLPRVEARKNALSLDAARATLKELQTWFTLARAADSAALRVLEIRRDRASLFMHQATTNSERMVIRAPIDGLVVLKTTWRSGGVNAIVQEGESVGSGTAVLDLIGHGPIRVRTKVNQVDVGYLRVGQTAIVHLDSDRHVAYPAHLETISPVAVRTGYSSEINTFTVVFLLDRAEAALTPDLSAAVDVDVASVPPSRMRGGG
jgi:multidrug resistance efflux pump